MTYRTTLRLVDQELTEAIEMLTANAETITERALLITPEIQRIMNYSKVLRVLINSDAAMQLGQRAFRDCVIPVIAMRRKTLKQNRQEVLDEVIEGLQRKYDHSTVVEGVKRAMKVVKRERAYDIYDRMREVVTPERYDGYIGIMRDYLPR
ncbi:MAG: hypothetical protein AABX98_05310 [Nanoarchaeota archaeon]